MLEEALLATVSMTFLCILIAGLYWGLTGFSPWPYLVLGEVAASGFGIVLLSLISPRRKA